MLCNDSGCGDNPGAGAPGRSLVVLAGGGAHLLRNLVYKEMLLSIHRQKSGSIPEKRREKVLQNSGGENMSMLIIRLPKFLAKIVTLFGRR